MTATICWQCDKLQPLPGQAIPAIRKGELAAFNACTCTMYYDGVVDYTIVEFEEGTQAKWDNGNNRYRAEWRCPGCGEIHVERWSGPRHPNSGIAVGCKCGLWIYSKPQFWREVDHLQKYKPQSYKLRYPPQPEKLKNGKYVCGCCDENLQFKVGQRVKWECNNESVGMTITGHHRQSQGHIVWEVEGGSSFGNGVLVADT